MADGVRGAAHFTQVASGRSAHRGAGANPGLAAGATDEQQWQEWGLPGPCPWL